MGGLPTIPESPALRHSERAECQQDDMKAVEADPDTSLDAIDDSRAYDADHKQGHELVMKSCETFSRQQTAAPTVIQRTKAPGSAGSDGAAQFQFAPANPGPTSSSALKHRVSQNPTASPMLFGLPTRGQDRSLYGMAPSSTRTKTIGETAPFVPNDVATRFVGEGAQDLSESTRIKSASRRKSEQPRTSSTSGQLDSREVNPYLQQGVGDMHRSKSHATSRIGSRTSSTETVKPTADDDTAFSRSIVQTSDFETAADTIEEQATTRDVNVTGPLLPMEVGIETDSRRSNAGMQAEARHVATNRGQHAKLSPVPASLHHDAAQTTRSMPDNMALVDHQAQDRNTPVADLAGTARSQQKNCPPTRAVIHTRSLHQRMNVPSIPEVLTVLGHAMCAQWEESDKAREARAAQLDCYREAVSDSHLQFRKLELQHQALEQEQRTNAAELRRSKESSQTKDKFIKGLTSDLQRSENSKKKLENDLKSSKEQVTAVSKALKEAEDRTTKATEDFNRERDKAKAAEAHSIELTRKVEALSREIESEQQKLRNLESDRDKCKADLAEYRSQNDTITKRLETHHGSIVEQIAKFSQVVSNSKDPEASKQISDISNYLRSLSSTTPVSMEGITQLLGRWEEKITESTTHNKTKQTEPDAAPDAAHAIQEQVRELLDHFKSEVIGWQALQQQLSSLREEKASCIEQLRAREAQIADISKRLEVSEQSKDSLQNTNAQLQAQIHNQETVAETEHEDQQRQTELLAQVDELTSSLTSKTQELEKLRSEYDAFVLKSQEEQKNLRVVLANDAAHKQETREAEYRNKMQLLENKYQKAQQQLLNVPSTAGPAGNRSSKVHAKGSSTTAADYERKLANLQKDNEAAQLTLRSEHEAALAQLARGSELALSAWNKMEQDNAQSKIEDLKRNLKEAHDLEKESLMRQVTDAVTSKATIERELESAKNAIQDWKDKYDGVLLARAHRTNHQSGGDQPDGPRADGSDTRAQESTDGRTDYQEIGRSSKIPTLSSGSRNKMPTRSVNRAHTARSQTPSMIFDDEFDDHESRPATQDSLSAPQHGNSTTWTDGQSKTRAGDGGQSMRQGIGYQDEDDLSSISEAALNAMADEAVACENDQIASPYRMPSSSNMKAHRVPTSGAQNEDDRSQSIGRKSIMVNNAAPLTPFKLERPKHTYSRTRPAQSEATPTSAQPPPKTLVRDSQKGHGKRARSPDSSHPRPTKRSRGAVAGHQRPPSKPNAFDEHVRATSRDGPMPNVGKSLAPTVANSSRTGSSQVKSTTVKPKSGAANTSRGIVQHTRMTRQSSVRARKQADAEMSKTFTNSLGPSASTRSHAQQ